MDIRNINIDIESIAELEGNLKDETLNKYLSNYTEALSQILGNISLPLAFLGMGMKKAISSRFTIEEAMTVVRLLENPDKDPKVTAKKLVSHFETLNKQSNKNLTEEIGKEIDNIFENIPEAKIYHRNLALNALTNSWTLFEAFSKDIWTHCLNKYPKKYIPNIINAKNNNEQTIDGISGKNISISLLSKYNFDISNNLGDLLASKYDFTSVKGIKKAFSELLQLKESELHNLDNTNLNQLEIIRHILVHSAGTIDNEYLKRSKRDSEVFGTKIELTAEEFNDYINSGIEAVKNIFSIMDSKINNS